MRTPVVASVICFRIANFIGNIVNQMLHSEHVTFVHSGPLKVVQEVTKDKIANNRIALGGGIIDGN